QQASRGVVVPDSFTHGTSEQRQIWFDKGYRTGDDALQQASRGVVVPDSFTHGTSEQRQIWFDKGYRTG
ncbi:hypothetical protein CNY89_30465, partial [Amaricoccus sp. HAR-UPW-R2A-40]